MRKKNISFSIAYPSTRSDSTRGDPIRKRWGARIYLWLCVVLVQVCCVLFFVSDVVTDVVSLGFVAHTTKELIATLALMSGAALGGIEVHRLIRRTRRAETSLQDATSAFSTLVRKKFADWQLTPGEAEIALLTLKGYDIAEIAGLRQSARGTVRSQLSQLYAKSGAGNRGQFVSSFIDVLIDAEVVTAPDNRPAKVARRPAGSAATRQSAV